MIVAYMDESGNTGSHLNIEQPFHYMGALVIGETIWRNVLRATETVLHAFTSAQHLNVCPELHGHPLFHGDNQWRAIPEIDRLDLYDKCLAVLETNGVYMVVGAADKTKLKQYSNPMDPRDIAFWITLEQLAQATDGGSELVFIVADDADATTQMLIRNRLTAYRTQGPPFGMRVEIDHIIDTVHFMSSTDSRHLQLCDLVLFGYQRHRSSSKNSQTFAPAFLRASGLVRYKRFFPY